MGKLPGSLWRGILDRFVAKTPPVRIELNDPRGVPLQVGAASPYPALPVAVVPEELEVGGLRNKVV